MNKEGPIIMLPSDQRVVYALRRKLEEYGQRVEREDRNRWEFRAPERRSHSDRYKLFVLGRLLVEGSVRPHDLCRELNERDGYVTTEFNNAASVIDAYCTGKDVIGGTGLSI